MRWRWFRGFPTREVLPTSSLCGGADGLIKEVFRELRTVGVASRATPSDGNLGSEKRFAGDWGANVGEDCISRVSSAPSQ
jgi:hypothetical protein